MWNETSRRMGPPYAAFVVIIECGMLLMVPIGGMFFLKGSLAASAFLLFVYVGSMYLTEIRPLQELGTNFANVLNAVTKTKEIQMCIRDSFCTPVATIQCFYGIILQIGLKWNNLLFGQLALLLSLIHI